MQNQNKIIPSQTICRLTCFENVSDEGVIILVHQSISSGKVERENIIWGP